MFLFIVRHGECYGNLNADLGPDTALTPLGEVQAARVGERMAELNVTHVISSPLLRALGTAQPIADQANLATFEAWMDLREGNHGEYWCEPRTKLVAAAPKAILPDELAEEGWLHKTSNNQAFIARCERVVAKIKQTFTHADRVAIVSHGIVGSHLLHLFLGMPLQQQQWFELENGSISALRLVADPVAERPNFELLPPVDVEVYCVNERRHLAGLEKE